MLGEDETAGGGIQDIEELDHLLFCHPQAGVYFKDAQYVFDWPQGALDVRTPECSSDCVAHVLQDGCIIINLVSIVFTTKKRWHIILTSTAPIIGDQKTGTRKSWGPSALAMLPVPTTR